MFNNLKAINLNHEQHVNNVYAYDINVDAKHISEVESGRRGYFCMGCGCEMQAKKGKKYSHYFSHDPKDVAKNGKCSYSDETYRHKLAKEILFKLKKVKVPALYKYPPKLIEGKPYKISDSKFLEAFVVELEMPFYEDENGEIMWGRSMKFKNEKKKHLLMQPDVAFFGINNRPFLFIEIVATNRINIEKILKLRRLGIDTIEITIPRSSKEEIESNFYKTNNTKWIYNYEQDNTEYIRIPQGNEEGIPPLDEIQRKIFESIESYECKVSQINSLIRGIKKCMGSEYYTGIEQSITGEIERVKRNTERNRRQLLKLQEKHSNEIEDELRNEREGVEAEELNFSQKQREFEGQYIDLDERYTRKREELITAQTEYRSDEQDEIDGIEEYFKEFGATAIDLEDSIRRVRESAEGMGRDIIIENETIISLKGRREGIQNEFVKSENYLRKLFERQITREEAEIKRIDKRRTSISNKYNEIETGIRNEFVESEEKIRIEIQGRREATIRTITEGNDSSEHQFGRRIIELIEVSKLLDRLPEMQFSIKRFRRAKELFENGTYKNWL